MAQEEIKVTGAREFVRSVHMLTSRLPSIQKSAGELAAELTIKAARPTIPYDTGRAADSLQVVATSSGAAVHGGEGIEYYGWLEIGGESGRQHANVRAIVASGRYIYPASQNVLAKALRAIEEDFEDHIRSTGLEVR